MKEEAKYRVTCPTCGNIFFRSDDSKAEVECSKCGGKWDVTVTCSEVKYLYLGNRKHQEKFG